MSVKERPDKKKEKEKVDNYSAKNEDKSIEDWLDNVSLDPPEQTPKTSSEDPHIAQSKEEIQIVSQDKHHEFIVSLPSWISKPWMYVQPTHQNQLESWLDSWKKVIVDYSRILTLHVINISELINQHPFNNHELNKRLTGDIINNIFEHMIQDGLAKWLDENHILVRIYYKTNEQWSSIIMEYLINTGLAAEVLTLYEVEKLEQEWSSIPRNELVEIFDILVTKKRAGWVGDTKDTLTFHL